MCGSDSVASVAGDVGAVGKEFTQLNVNALDPTWTPETGGLISGTKPIDNPIGSLTPDTQKDLMDDGMNKNTLGLNDDIQGVASVVAPAVASFFFGPEMEALSGLGAATTAVEGTADVIAPAVDTAPPGVSGVDTSIPPPEAPPPTPPPPTPPPSTPYSLSPVEQAAGKVALKAGEGGALGAVNDPKDPGAGFLAGAESGAIIGAAGQGANAIGNAMSTPSVTGTSANLSIPTSGGITGSNLGGARIGDGFTAQPINYTPLTDSNALGTPSLTGGNAGLSNAPLDSTNALGTGQSLPTQVGTQTSSPDQGMWDKILGQVTNHPWQAASLGINAVSAIEKARSGNQMQDQLKKLGQPIADVEQNLLNQYQSGNIPAGTAFDIQTWHDQQVAAVKSQYAKAGMSGSTAERNAEAQLGSKADAMRDQARQGLLTQGLQAAGVANAPLTQAITAQAQQDQQLMQSQSSALNSLMLMQAMQNKSGS